MDEPQGGWPESLLTHLRQVVAGFEAAPVDEEALDQAVANAVTAVLKASHRRDRARERLRELARDKGARRAVLAARNSASLQGPGLVLALIELAVEERTRDPEASLVWAKTAVSVAERESSSLSLQARAWAEMGNGQRLHLDFPDARRSLRKAQALLDEAGGGDPSFRGEVFSLWASLEANLHRVDEALDYIEKALQCFKVAHLKTDRLLTQRAHLLTHKGEFSVVVDDLVEVLASVLSNRNREPTETLAACHNALYALAEIASSTPCDRERQEAVTLFLLTLVKLDHVYMRVEAPAWKARQVWLCGRVEAADGHFDRAYQTLKDAIRKFTALGQTVAAAVATLDLGLVLLRQGAYTEMRESAKAACQVFEAKGMYPVLWASLRELVDCDVSEAEAIIVDGLKKAGSASLRRTPGPRHR